MAGASRSRVRTAALALALCLLAACTSAAGQGNPTPTAALSPAPAADVAVAAAPLAVSPQPCSGAFITHNLDHITRAHGEVTRLFDSNGAGLAVNDLDGDGRLDIVLADLSGPATILWNKGDFQFDRQPLNWIQRARGVASVDVDGDGLLDIVFTTGVGAPAWMRNQGGRQFALTALPGVARPAYAMAWADLNGDGHLDLVTGSYDAAIMSDKGPNYLFGAAAGVNVYVNDVRRWQETQLATKAQALAIAVWDLNDDGRPDIWVGNDFDEPDRFWAQAAGGWQEIHPFAKFTHSTMSLDRGDIQNDGAWAIYATDMKPYQQDVGTLAQYIPFMEKGYQTRRNSSTQISENMLRVKSGGSYRNEAYERSADATGWTWSAKFGDLNNDGFQDIYAVNGMIAQDLLGYLPGDALVEANQALRNDGAGNFVRAPEWQLGSTASGRGMSMADLDGDGRLDIVVNNLNSPSQVFENRLCGGDSLEVDLRWPASPNRFAVGAVLTLATDRGSYRRDVRVESGYLSGDPTRIHFGFPAGTHLQSLTVDWPDGARSQVQSPAANNLLAVTRQ